MARFFACLSIVILGVLPSVLVYAGEPLKPPRCVERVCLDRIERYKNQIKVTRESDSGPIVFLENDEGFVSAGIDEMEGSNWVQVSFCASPGVIKTIHRTTTSDKGADYDMLLELFEKRYGKGANLNTGGTIYEIKHSWKWVNPPTELSLMKIRGSKYLSIELHDLSLEEKDFKCAGREPPLKKIADANAPALPEGTRGKASPIMAAPSSEMGDNMDPGLTAREVLYIMCMQDAMQLLTDMIDVQDRLMGKLSPAERDPIRQELRRIRETSRRIGLDYRGALAGQLRSE
jgi:hypothetical protein